MWDGALVMDVDRLARGDTIDQDVCSVHFFIQNTPSVTPNKTYDPANEYDNEYFEFSLFMSRREYATIKRRMQRGRERSSSDGYYVGNVAPMDGSASLRRMENTTLSPHIRQKHPSLI